MEIVNGTVFSTDFETGCVACEVPDETGDFGGLDSEGAEVSFSVVMIIGHDCYVTYPATKTDVKKALTRWAKIRKP